MTRAKRRLVESIGLLVANLEDNSPPVDRSATLETVQFPLEYDTIAFKLTPFGVRIWRDVNEFYSGFHEHGIGFTLAEAMKDFHESGDRSGSCPWCDGELLPEEIREKQLRSK